MNKNIFRQVQKTVSKMQNKTIAQQLRTFEQKGGTCYAHAIASVINQTSLRIFGRKPEDHHKVANKIISKYGTDGADVMQVLRDQCPKRQLRWQKIQANQAFKILSIRDRSILATFCLSQKGWDDFSNQIKTNGMISKSPQLGNEGHAVVLVGVDSNCWIIKNSWGDQWASNGFAKVSFGALKFQFYDVYFIVEDLTKEDVARYKEHKLKESLELSNKDYQLMLQLGKKALQLKQYQDKLSPGQKRLWQNYKKNIQK